MRRAEVRYEGPITPEEKKSWDGLLARRAGSQEEVNYYADKYRRARDERKKAMWLDSWHWEQRLFDIINDAMPERYKAKLENRSYREGASREGKTLEEHRKNRRG